MGHRALPLRPLRRNVKVYVPLAKRNVTTDAASSHAEKEHVPEVRKRSILRIEGNQLTFTYVFRKIISLSKSRFLMKASKPMNSTLPHTP